MNDALKNRQSRFQSLWSRALLLAPLCIMLASTSAWADVQIGRQWAATAPTINGVVSAGEWDGARSTPLARGVLKTMNNGSFLYILIDVTGDPIPDPVPTPGVAGDAFVLAFDVDLNRAVTPNVDIVYSTCQDGRPFVKAYYVAPSQFTGCMTVNPQSLGALGYGLTPDSLIPHRIWELRLDFGEIGVDPSTWTTSSGDVPRVRVNVATISRNPFFSTAQPDSNEYPNLSNMFQLDLATSPTYPRGSTGPIFAGVGLVPFNYIDSAGYANINIAGYYSATAAPWGGKLNIFGLWNDLYTSRGARAYRVRYSKDGGPLTRLRQTWTNFLFNSGTSVWDPMAIGPDADDKYAIPPPSQVWYLPNLLMSWQSDLFGDGTYKLSLELFDGAGNPIPIGDGNSLALFVVNTPPVPVINNVLYNDATVCPCGIVTQGDAPTGFNFRISVTDSRGALGGFGLYGIYGDNQSTGYIYSDGYGGHMNEDGPERWNGVTNLYVPIKARWRADQACAYSFILFAYSRSQNGYGLVFPNVSYHVSLTILLGRGTGFISGCPPSSGNIGTDEAPAPACVVGNLPAAMPSKALPW